jgi:hypothetical protein
LTAQSVAECERTGHFAGIRRKIVGEGISNVAQRKRTAWVPSREKAGQIARSSVPYDSPQCVFCREYAKVAPIAGILIAFLRVLETADSLAEGAGFEFMVRFLAAEVQRRP